MILPADFVDTISADALDDFLDHLITSNAGADSYDGDLAKDRAQLLQALRKGKLLIEHHGGDDENEDDTGSFRLITADEAIKAGYHNH